MSGIYVHISREDVYTYNYTNMNAYSLSLGCSRGVGGGKVGGRVERENRDRGGGRRGGRHNFLLNRGKYFTSSHFLY